MRYNMDDKEFVASLQMEQLDELETDTDIDTDTDMDYSYGEYDPEYNNIDITQIYDPVIDHVNRITSMSQKQFGIMQYVNEINKEIHELSQTLSNIDFQDQQYTPIYGVQGFLDSDTDSDEDMDDVKMVLLDGEFDRLITENYEEMAFIRSGIDEDDVCSICLQEFEKNEMLTLLNCSHLFHTECVKTQLTEYTHKCPVCRTSAGKYTPLIE